MAAHVDRLDVGTLEASIAVAVAAYDIAGYGPVNAQAVKTCEQGLPGLLAVMQRGREAEPVALAVRPL